MRFGIVDMPLAALAPLGLSLTRLRPKSRTLDAGHLNSPALARRFAYSCDDS